ncbi:hypothetical protein, partial [Serratia sp. Se-RSmG]|uniref:hypothetical protein n=1 Tax=Serratia sp. Se-RSmG TaxID=3043307 RepID=UPI0024AFB41B
TIYGVYPVPERGVNVNEQLKYMSFDKECGAAIVPKRDFCRILLFFTLKQRLILNIYSFSMHW